MSDKNRGKRRGLALLLCNMHGKLKPTSTKKIKGVQMTVFCNKKNPEICAKYNLLFDLEFWDQCNVIFFLITNFHQMSKFYNAT